MRSIEALLSHLNRLKIKVWSDQGELCYKCSKGSMTPALKTEMREQKAAILAFLDENQIIATRLPKIIPFSGKGPLPLSFGQQRLWFLAQLEGQSTAYNMPAAWKLSGRLDESALEKTLKALMQKHQGLRLSFPAVDGEAIAQLNPIYNPLHISDLCHLSEADQQAHASQQMFDHAQAPFDLARGPLFSVLLLKLGHEQILQFNIHHIISDGWSMEVLLRDWGRLYHAHIRHQAPGPAGPSIQYTDYARWQRGWLKDEILANQLAYWKKKLSRVPEFLELPLDFSRPAMMSDKGRHLKHKLSIELSRDIRRLSRNLNVTVFMTLMAAFKVLLYRYSGQTDLVVGSPVANRSHSQTENIVGLFANTLVFRTQIHDGESFFDYLAQVKQTAVEAFAHQDIPFEYLVEQINPCRSLSHTPLFQVMFVLQKTPGQSFDLSEVNLSYLELERPTAPFDLTLEVTDTGNAFVCDWEYPTALFRRDSIAGMGKHFQVLLEGIVQNPHQPPSQLPLMTEAGYRQLAAWNQTKVSFPENLTILDLFEAQAERTPGKIAVVHGDDTLTYDQLNRDANRLAHHLITMGVCPETLVGICVERSPEMLIGLLGILKAGGAYLPLDPGYPIARLQYMIEDSSCPVLLTQGRLLTRLPETTGKILCLDRQQEQLGSYPQENPVRRSGPGNPAYVIYTSGSTGKPKGVVIEHSALNNYVHSAMDAYCLSSKDRVLQFSSICFDVAAEEIFPILSCGGRLILRNDALLESNLDFLTACRLRKITVLSLPTAYWQQLISSDDHKSWPEFIRLVVIGGEAVSMGHIRRWQQTLGPRCQLINAYGPTEATISATYHLLTESANHFSIGKPFPNTRVYILDPHHTPTPVGIPGELCISGAGLARGYLNRPELTLERFIEIQIDTYQRIYKTGDKARRLADGTIEYLGRMDDQVKLRGFRIEPSEIEATLTGHRAVKETVVVLEDKQGNQRLIAYVTLSEPVAQAAQVLSDWLKDRLPEYMLPAGYVVLDKLPLTPGGKVDRKALPDPQMESIQTRAPFETPQTNLEQQIAQVWQKVLKLDKVGIHDNFFDLGGHSLLLIQVQSRIQAFIDQPLTVIKLFQYPTIQALAAYLTGPAPLKNAQPDKRHVDDSRDIAIIGMAGRFPGAQNIDIFWNNLCQGLESIRFFTDEELHEQGIDAALIDNPAYVKARGVLEGAQFFDAPFFGYTPAEAKTLDPQERVLLETAWTAMEHAGYDVTRMDVPVGIYAGAGMRTCFTNHAPANGPLHEPGADFQTTLNSDKDFIATRTAYKLNLKGPAITLHTACSTSLVAVHMAGQSLLNNECEMALAGGVSITFPQTSGYLYQDGMIGSPDGHCRAFDARAQGIVGGNGVGMVVLKRLSCALADRDTIHGVIKGSAVNNDGMDKVGYTAPGIQGQSAVIRQAMKGLDYESIGYLEAHGTGTELGDPIEVSALTQAFQTGTQKTHYCAMGSVKTNVGHLDTAAGVAGLIKTVLALKHRQIPPSLHFKTPNPQIDFANSPFFVNTRLKPWKSALPRRAGVSSFGIGGTNAHLVLEQAPGKKGGPTTKKRTEPEEWFIFCLSARTENTLEKYRHNMAHYLTTCPEQSLADVSFTLNSGRKAFSCRGFLIGQTPKDCAKNLGDKHQWHQQNRTADKQRPVVFMFPGQGAQYLNMGHGLYKGDPGFREIIDKCAQLLEPAMGLDIRKVLYAPATATGVTPTKIAQPALFVTEYALAKLFMARGISPVAMIGHSIGEYVAACLAGVFSLEDALKLVALRSRLMQSLPRGRMLSVGLSADKLVPMLASDLSLAAHNAPHFCVVSGSSQAVEALETQLAAQDIQCRRLHTSHAFHSVMMAPIVEAYRIQLTRVKLHSPQIPYISNLTGTWITQEQPTDPDYWCQHLQKTVHFSDGVATLMKDSPHCALVEVGPGKALATFARQHPGTFVVNALKDCRSPQKDIPYLLTAMGKLWLGGATIQWNDFYGQQSCRRLPLPTYPFEQKRYWIDPPDPQGAAVLDTPNLSDWFYVPIWQREKASLHHQGHAGLSKNWLVFTDQWGLGNQLATKLNQEGIFVITVGQGTGFTRVGARAYTLNPGQTNDYETLFTNLAAANCLPQTIIHLWGVTKQGDTVGPGPLPDEQGNQLQQSGFYSLLFIAQALWQQSAVTKFQIEVVTNHVQAVTGTECLCPEKATVLGPVKVIPQEYPNISCRNIDIELPQSFSECPLADQLLAQFRTRPTPANPLIALRGAYRWEQSFAPRKLGHDHCRTGFRKNGVYLITGGLGGLGMGFAQYLAKTVQAKLVLVSRSKFPPRAEWAKGLKPPKKYSKHCLDSGTDRKAIDRMASELKSDLGFEFYDSHELDLAMDELCSGYIHDYLGRHADTNPGQIYHRVDLQERLGILPKFEKFYDFMLNVLVEDRIIKVENNQIEFLERPRLIDVKTLRSTIEQNHPDFRKNLALLDHCVSGYSEALTGRAEAIAVLYPQGETALLTETKDQPLDSIDSFYICLLRDIIAKIIDNAPRKKLKILEVGGGNGGVNKALRLILNQYNAEYHFTDLGNFFVVNARKDAEATGVADWMRFNVLDISKDPGKQGYDNQKFDIIIGFNVVHATPDIRQALGHLKHLLIPGGLLCLIETVKQKRWTDMVWGMAEGWWYFQDTNLRINSPLLTINQWEKVLADQGFQEINAFPGNPAQQERAESALVIAQKPEKISPPGDSRPGHTQNFEYQVRMVNALEAYGSQVMILSADVADLRQMESVHQLVKAQFGEIHGLIHAAGIEGGGTIQVQAAKMAKQEFRPKVLGTRVLEKVFLPDKPDFLMLCSSHNSLLGGTGQVGYGAANAFLDTYAQANASQSDTLTVSINWDRWQGIGMAAKVEATHLARSGNLLTGGLTAEEGAMAFQCILSKETLSQVVVSKKNFTTSLPSMTGTPKKEKEAIKKRKPTDACLRPDLACAYVAPRFKVEQTIADLWQEVLGIEPIGVHDDFHELGGDSLMATRVVSRIRQLLDVELTVRDLLERTTIALLAEYLTASLVAPNSRENPGDYCEEEEL